jgi:DNA-binding XRE family transcriptional regulator
MREEFYKQIPNLLRKYRRMYGYTQKKVALVLGVKPGMVCKWEKGKCLPNLVTVFRLAILYRTMADSLFMDHIRHLRKEMQERIDKFIS